MVFVNNVYQDPAVYSITDGDVVFVEDTPESGDRISIINFATIISPNAVSREETDDSAIAFAIAMG